MTTARELLVASAWPVQRRESVTPADVWAGGGRSVLQAPRMLGADAFYPVYRMGDLYAHSPLGLLAHAGDLVLNEDVARAVGDGVRRYWSGVETLDRRIVRIGAPRLSTQALRGKEEFIERFCAALRADIAEAEARHPGTVNAVLCGGRDSLNLLLLPWKNPVVALSAAPNFALVQRFVADNGLRIEVRELVDEDRSLLDHEILANLCRLELSHCRWAGELRAFANETAGRVVFWKGQLADTFLTPYWRTYTHPPRARRTLWMPPVRGFLKGAGGQSFFWWSLYHRGAMWQGTHMSLLRGLLAAPVLSAYHGPAVGAVLAELDLAHVVDADLRTTIGERLAGGAVRYPTVNPGPAPSDFRRGRSGVAPLLEVAARAGLRVRH